MSLVIAHHFHEGLCFTPISLKYFFMRHLAIPCFFCIILPLHAQTSESSERKLNEAVVTARPNINALDIRAKSGVVQTVNMKLLLNKPMIDMSMALQGSVPGLVK